MIFAFLKIIHIVALMFGSAASLGNLYMLLSKGPHDLPSPDFTNKLRYFFRITGLVAILTLWVSGTILLVVRYGGWVDAGAFSAKLIFATVLLLIISFLNLMAWFVWTPLKPPPAYVPILHMIATPVLFLAAIFAVITFA